MKQSESMELLKMKKSMNRLNAFVWNFSVLICCGVMLNVASAQDGAPGQAEIDAAETDIVIHAGHLIAEPGKPAGSNKSIIVRDGRVVEIRDGFIESSEVIDLSDYYVLPGMINLHTHMALPSYREMGVWRLQRPAAVLLKALPGLKEMVEAGFTTVRDLGDESSIMYELADATEKGTVAGPRILASEPFFGIGNGYTSAHSSGFKPELEPFYVNRGQCVSRDQCRNAVREEVRRGAKVIKIRLSFLPLSNPGIESVETVEEIKWIIDMAHELDRTVTVHTVVGDTLTPVSNAILAGADSIEHGPVGPKQVSLMKKHGTTYVPTLLVAKVMIGQFPTLYPRIAEGAALAHKEGVKLGFGTDYPLVEISRSVEEFLAMEEAGLTPREALMTATVNAAELLNMSDEIGSLKLGSSADVIAVKKNPEEDLSTMGDVVFVMKSGNVMKSAER